MVNSLGANKFAQLVEDEWQRIKDSALLLDQKEIDRVKSFFTSPEYDEQADQDTSFGQHLLANKQFANWVKRNVRSHKISGYRAVFVSLKAPKMAPGDATDVQMDSVADIAEQYSYGEIVVTHDQNLVLANVKQADLYSVWQALNEQNLATPNIGLLTDMICCPGLDFCSLANAGSIPIAKQINEKFADLDYLHDIGEIKVKMSGCMNACGHHHVGHIGILGVDKKGVEFYQFTLGGTAENDAALGDRLGPAIEKDKVADTIEKILDVYVEQRIEEERFLDTYKRLGIAPFKERVYKQEEVVEKEVAVAGY